MEEESQEEQEREVSCESIFAGDRYIPCHGQAVTIRDVKNGRRPTLPSGEADVLPAQDCEI